MSGIRRSLAIAALWSLAAAAGARAQTVTVIKAAPGSTFAVALNGDAIGSTTVDTSGIASIDVKLDARGGKQQTDVRVAIDACGNLVRVYLSEPGQQPPAAEAECARTEIAGTYVMRRISTFVVDLSSSTPAVWLRQGSAPETWLHPELMPEGHEWRPMPTGLVISGGGGLAWYGGVVESACGDAPTCDGRNLHGALNAAVTFWMTRAFAAEVAYVQPGDAVTTGSGTGYRFTNTVQSRFVTIAGKVAASGGPARVYGMGGVAYHRAVSNTLNVIDPSTITAADGTTILVPGGTQTAGVDSRDWDWMAGGGVEFWVKGPLAIYVDGGYAPLKGANRGGGEARFADHIIWTVAGARFHLLSRGRQP